MHIATDATTLAPLPEVSAALIAEWIELLSLFRGNKEHQATTFITLCIDAGFNRRTQIKRTAHLVGLDPDSVMATLRVKTGDHPVRHRWRRGEDSLYSLH